MTIAVDFGSRATKQTKLSNLLTNNSCMAQNLVTFWDIFRTLYRNDYHVNTMRLIQLSLHSISELWLFDFVLSLVCVVYILARSITHSLFMISSCNFKGMYIM